MALTTWLGLMAWALNNSQSACDLFRRQVAPVSVGTPFSGSLLNPFHVPRNSTTFKAVEPKIDADHRLHHMHLLTSQSD